MTKPVFETDCDGSYWYFDDKCVKYHREDGPAVEKVNGYQAWYLNGEYHRENGPAVIYPNGNEFWYLNGNYHGIRKPDNWNELVSLAQVRRIMNE